MALVISHLDFDGNTEAEFENPAGLSWSYQIGAKGPGQIQYTLHEADPGVATDEFAPKRTDVQLTLDGIPLIAGPMWSVNMPLRGDLINIVAHDWMQWLDQPPHDLFDYTDPIGSVIASGVAADFLTVWPAGSTVQDIVEALLAPLSADPTEQIILSPIFSGAAFAEELSGYLERSASTGVLSMLQQLSLMGAPFGFDFWCHPDKTLEFVGPRVTSAGSYTPSFGLYDASVIADGEWTNNGPAGTDIVFVDGGRNTKRYWRKTHADSVTQFRRWCLTHSVDGGDTQSFQIGGQTDGDYKAQASQQRLMYPQRELSLTVYADQFTFYPHLMEAVDIDYEKFPGCYHRIDSAWWITSQTYRQATDGSGDWLCDLTLDQINTPI